MAPEPVTLDTSDDAVLGGRLRLRQPLRGHRVGHDAILLAAATAAKRRRTCGRSRRRRRRRRPCACGRALPGSRSRSPRSIRRCARLRPRTRGATTLADRVRAVELDVTRMETFAAAGLGAGKRRPRADEPAVQRCAPAERLARSPAAGWRMPPRPIRCRAGSRRRPGCSSPPAMLTLIWRADGLDEVLEALEGGFGSVTVLPVYPRPDAAAIRVLVRADKGGTRAARAACRASPSTIRRDSRQRPPKPCCGARSTLEFYADSERLQGAGD